jgi:hypothetical protein
MTGFLNELGLRTALAHLSRGKSVSIARRSAKLGPKLGYCDFANLDNQAPLIWALEWLAPADMGRASRNMAEN